MALLLESIEQYNDFFFIKYEKYTKDVSSIFCTQFIQTILDKFYKLRRESVLCLEQKKSILNLFLLFFLQGTHE